MYTSASFVSARITTPAPITLRAPMRTLSRMVALTPMKLDSPTSTDPDTTTCEARKQWSPTVEWCPMWLPAHSHTSRPRRENGCRLFSSITKVLLSGTTDPETSARELM